MKTVCTIGRDYLGADDCEFAPDYRNHCNYYCQKEDDPDYPSVLPKVCGNCIHWIVIENE